MTDDQAANVKGSSSSRKVRDLIRYRLVYLGLCLTGSMIAAGALFRLSDVITEGIWTWIIGSAVVPVLCGIGGAVLASRMLRKLDKATLLLEEARKEAQLEADLIRPGRGE